MLEIRRVWHYASETDAVHFMIATDGDQRHIKLKKSENRELYKFIVEHSTERQPDDSN